MQTNKWIARNYIWKFYKEDPGVILPTSRLIFDMLRHLSLNFCIHSFLEKKRSLWWVYKNQYRVVDVYVIFWLATEVLFFVFVGTNSFIALNMWFILLMIAILSLFMVTKFHKPILLGVGVIAVVIGIGLLQTSSFQWFVQILILYRLFDIFQAWVNDFVLMPNWQPVDPRRTLVLVFIGFLEVIISYALFAFIYQTSFYIRQSASLGQSLYYSVRTATTISADWKPKSLAGYFIFYTELVFAILFVTAVIGQIFSYIGNKRE